jgi:hypothetical protein
LALGLEAVHPAIIASRITRLNCVSSSGRQKI